MGSGAINPAFLQHLTIVFHLSCCQLSLPAIWQFRNISFEFTLKSMVYKDSLLNILQVLNDFTVHGLQEAMSYSVVEKPTSCSPTPNEVHRIVVNYHPHFLAFHFHVAVEVLHFFLKNIQIHLSFAVAQLSPW